MRRVTSHSDRVCAFCDEVITRECSDGQRASSGAATSINNTQPSLLEAFGTTLAATCAVSHKIVPTSDTFLHEKSKNHARSGSLDARHSDGAGANSCPDAALTLAGVVKSDPCVESCGMFFRLLQICMSDTHCMTVTDSNNCMLHWCL